MSELTEFLLARIAEDEAAAQAAVDPDRPGTHWQWVRQDDRVVEDPSFDDMPMYLGTVEEFPTGSAGGDLPAFALNFAEADDSRAFPHIARHDPARVLAECAAKRATIERAIEAHRAADAWTKERLKTDTRSPLSEWARRDAYVEVLRDMASIYADHPDYRAEWAL